MTTPEGEELTPLNDMDNVRFIVVEDEEPGFTPSEVDAVLNTPPELLPNDIPES